ncbi:hypothetical protein [Shewanella algae]|uniref:hypothetical protein n=1 Tax=Shewanella algae TaxID=38313 RepID=UPI00313AB82B
MASLGIISTIDYDLLEYLPKWLRQYKERFVISLILKTHLGTCNFECLSIYYQIGLQPEAANCIIII